MVLPGLSQFNRSPGKENRLVKAAAFRVRGSIPDPPIWYARGVSETVVVETSLGSFCIELDREHAPLSVENFLGYVDAGHYTGTVFHRVISSYIIQGGGYDTAYDKRPTEPPVQSEADNGLKNLRGTVAMARSSEPHSAKYGP